MGGSVENGSEPGDRTTGSITGMGKDMIAGAAGSTTFAARFPYLNAIEGVRPQSFREVWRRAT
jgi:hypothetical protein